MTNEPRVDATNEWMQPSDPLTSGPVNRLAIEDFELISQLSAGPEGVAYRAQRICDRQPVEIWRLRPSTETLRRIRLASLVTERHVRRLMGFQLDGDVPYVAMVPGSGRTVREAWTAEPRPDLQRSLEVAHDVANVLAQCHQLGLVVARLAPGDLRWDDAAGVNVDVLGVDVGQFVTTDIALGDWYDSDDVLRWAELLAWLVTNEPQADSKTMRSAVQTGLGPVAEGFGASLETFLHLTELATSADRDARPAAFDLVQALKRLLPQRSDPTTVGGRIEPLPSEPPARGFAAFPAQFGRFRIQRELGRGGMGTVFLAEDLADGSLAALKVLHLALQQDPSAVARFRREARLLGEIHSPYVARLLDVNIANGMPYLAMEYVAGWDLNEALRQYGRFPERWAISLIARVAEALGEAHARGIVHRDIKPANILLAGERVEKLAGDVEPDWRVKLVDFGLARRTQQSESMNVTRSDVFVGTPAYMAPEQSTGQGEVDARADIYSLGCTLYEMLAGRLPFESPDVMGLIFKHSYEAHPPVKQWNDALSDGVARIVDKCLAKKPELRYADGRELHAELAALLLGQAAKVHAHPLLPPHDPSRVLAYDWSWELQSSPADLWPHVSDTERLNRAAGLPAVQYTTQHDSRTGVRRFGEFKFLGQKIRWQEHPYEWIEGRRMAVLREFQSGPFEWFTSRVELTARADGGATLRHQVRIVPRGLLGRLVAYLEIERKARKALTETYERIDAELVSRKRSANVSDPFESTPALRRMRRKRLDLALTRLEARGVERDVTEKLGEFLSRAPAQQVARIRPLALAAVLGVAPERMVDACLLAAHEGLLVLHWDILCPSCRIASEIQQTLKNVREHGHCEACNLNYEIDWTHSVEMIFQVHPDIREGELRTYCVGGPQHYPHVAAQLRLQPGELLETELRLSAGDYVLRGPQLPHALPMTVHATRGAAVANVRLPVASDAEPLWLRAGEQTLTLHYSGAQELLVRVERTIARRDVFSAAQASSLAIFRELFPTEVLAEGQLAAVARMTFLSLRLDGWTELAGTIGDARAFSALLVLRQEIQQLVRKHRGTLVRHDQHGALLAFGQIADGVRASLELTRATRSLSPEIASRVGVHSGSALVITSNDQLDYFGANVERSHQLAELGEPHGIVFSRDVAADPFVAQWIRELRLEAEVCQMPQSTGEMALRIKSR